MEWLNYGAVPDKYNEARLVLMSKSENKNPFAEPCNTRPICIKSHAVKAYEKTILEACHQEFPALLEVQDWQQGFHEDRSTHVNIARVNNDIHNFRDKAFLFIDFKKAFDSVDRKFIIDELVEEMRRYPSPSRLQPGLLTCTDTNI